MSQAERDAQDLAAFGHEQTLARKFSIVSMLSLAFCVLGTWAVCAQGLSSGIENGGPVTVLWGLVLVTICNTCLAMSLGELCSSMPTALGQAFWVSQLWRTPTGRFVSYMCAWINVFGWLCLTASQIAFMAEFSLSMKVMFDEAWPGASTGWVLFLVYVGITVLFTFVNLVGCRDDNFLPYFNNFVAVGFVGLFAAFCLVLPISVGTRSGLEFQPANFVFRSWVNNTGWSDGVVWFLGLVQAAYGLTAFDSVLHMVEELPNPRRNAPRTMIAAVVLGAISGFLFMIACLFCIQDVDRVLDPPSGFPFIELVQSTVGIKGAAALIALFIFNGFGQGISVLTSASRLTWSFARDQGMPFGQYFSYVHPVWKVPARALVLQAAVITLIGVLYLFSNTALEAILSISTIALTISYAIPIGVLLAVGRDKLPAGEFRLGKIGAVVNWVSIVYSIVTTVFFFFPATPNPALVDMNFAIAVFGVMLILSVGFWFVKGRRSFLQSQGFGEDVLDGEGGEGEVENRSKEEIKS